MRENNFLFLKHIYLQDNREIEIKISKMIRRSEGLEKTKEDDKNDKKLGMMITRQEK